MKAHLFIYADRTQCPDGKPCTKALCGRWVNHPDMRINWAIDEDAEFPALNSLKFCGLCIKKVEAYGRDPATGELTTKERFYIAAIVDGEVAKHTEEP